jgi:hypothetical protein
MIKAPIQGVKRRKRISFRISQVAYSSGLQPALNCARPLEFREALQACERDDHRAADARMRL